MHVANVIFASIILFAMFGAATIAQGGDRRPAVERNSITPAATWLWQPVMRRASR